MPTFTLDQLKALADSVAAANQLDPALFGRLINQESRWNPNARSPVGAMGLTQLMPDTAADLGVTDILDPRQNLTAGGRYLRQQMNRFGSVPLALAAYNAGPGNVEKYGGVPPFEETQNYVSSIMGGNFSTEAIPREMLEALMSQVDTAFGPSMDSAEEVQGYASEARARAAAAQRELVGAQAEPVGSTDPISDLITRALGGVRDVVAGGDAGSQQAEKLITADRSSILQRRVERLNLLADTAERAANEAAKAGSVADELKLRVQAERASKQAEAALQASEQYSRRKNSEFEQNRADTRSQREVDAANTRAQTAEEQKTIRSLIAAKTHVYNPNTKVLTPLDGATRLEPRDWQNAVTNAERNTENKGGSNTVDALLRRRYLGINPQKGWGPSQYVAWVKSLRKKNGDPLFNMKNAKEKAAVEESLNLWFPEGTPIMEE